MHREELNPDPFVQFTTWFEAAHSAGVELAEAMSLATADSNGRPSARTVLLRGFDGLGFVFYTNYDSRKGRDIERNPKAALLFWWKEMHRQVRIEGSIVAVSRMESETYFAGRPRGSQLAAWASQQSRTLADRESLDQRFRAFSRRLEGRSVPCPPHWGGYRLTPDTFEFWEEGEHRLHDRLRYLRSEEDDWAIERLAP